MSAFLDTNVVIHHLTSDPPDQATGATAALRGAERLLLVDLVVAEIVFVLESVYEVGRGRIAQLVRSLLAFPAVSVGDAQVLLRSLEIYEHHRLHFAEAYLAACAELSGAGRVLSFDRALDRIGSIERLEPGA